MEIGTTINGDIVRIESVSRDRHLYVIGQTGTGKSTLFHNSISQDLAAGEGVVLIDPHGTLSRDVVFNIPQGRDDDLIYLHLAHLPAPISFNLLADVHPDERATRAGNIVGAFVSIFGDKAVADRSQMLLRNSLIALMERENETLLSVIRLLRDDTYRRSVIDNISDPLARSYWLGEFDLYEEKFREQVTAPILNKFDAFFAYPAIRHVLSQPKNRINLERVIRERKILIINLAGLSDGADHVFGALAVSAIWAAARSVNGPPNVGTPLYLYIDEFQKFTTNSIEHILSEARKFKLCLSLGHQFWGQVNDDIKHAVFGNVGTQIAYRVGALDAPITAKQFGLSEEQVRDLPDFSAYILPKPPASSVRFQANPPPDPLRKSPDALIANSLSHFATKRGDVEGQIKAMFPA